MKYLDRIQTLLPLGYLYLILMGLLKESVQYYQLGINILKYSSITDILISPISELSSSPVVVGVVILVFILLYVFQLLLIKYKDKSWAKRILGQNRFDSQATKKEIQSALLPISILFLAYLILSLFVGLGIGEGRKISREISQGKFRNNYKISFGTGKTEEAYVFDSNSSFYFYVNKGSRNIKIAPVGSISTIELIYNKKLN
ncbi:hypothetical protein ACXZ1K_10905 [Pedobacter sp. PWIIR3]